MAPEGNCLQYHTASTGNFASFAWDFNTYGPGVTGLKGISYWTQFHLANQHYNVCFRREQGKSGICYQAQIEGATTAIADKDGAASFGLGGSAKATAVLVQNDGVALDASTATNGVGISACQGYTTWNQKGVISGAGPPAVIPNGRTTGDYLEIPQAFTPTTNIDKFGQASKVTRV